MNTFALVTLLVLAGCQMSRVAGGDDRAGVPIEPTREPTLPEAAEGRFLIGTAIMARALDDPAVADLIRTQYNAITAENELKPKSVQPEPGAFDFTAGDKLADFAEANDIALIGHTLVWHQQAPAWMFEDEAGEPLPRDEALENMRAHIHTVVKHFKGRVHGWDVVNEAISDNGPYLRDTPALRAIGDDYVIKAFEFAREADPDVELYYNDFNIELDYKRDKALRLLAELDAAGVRPDRVGIQGHWLIGGPDIEQLERGLTAYFDAGYDIDITELDIDMLPRDAAGADLDISPGAVGNPYADGLPDERQQALADRYREIFELLTKYDERISRVTFWGTHDGATWLNGWPVRGRTNHPLLFDRQLQPKPAFDAVIEVLQAKKQ
ncbi:MAG: endo-1,4-beta-xylanase [Planctomycetota bacterium]